MDKPEAIGVMATMMVERPPEFDLGKAGAPSQVTDSQPEEMQRDRGGLDAGQGSAGGMVVFDADHLTGGATDGPAIELATGPQPAMVESTGEDQHWGDGVRQVDLGVVSIPGGESGLELHAPEPEPPADPVLQETDVAETDPLSVREVANFGEPEPGVVGTLKYWLWVRKRLKELTVEHEQAVDQAEALRVMHRKMLVELGRGAHQAGLKSEVLDKLMSRALLAEGEFRGAERRHMGLAGEHQAKLEPLDAAIMQIEAEIAPLRQREEKTQAERKKLEGKRKGIDTKLKRAEIDLRNMEQLIEQRQEAYADLEKPKEEREKILTDIATFDKRRPGLLGQIRGFEEKLKELEAPIAEVDKELDEIRRLMDPALKKIEAINHKKEELTRTFSEEAEAMSRLLEEETRKAEDAWSAVGERVIFERRKEPQIEQLMAKVVDVMQRSNEAQRRIALLLKCFNSYNHEVVAKAQKIAYGGVAGIVLLIVLFIIIL